MLENKPYWIADYLTYPIQVSNIEKITISTQIFNRLHNILQNSTAFHTYPTNRTTRFSHSLGTMHLAGEIYRFSLINADAQTKSLFWKNIREAIKKYQISHDYHDKVTIFFPDIQDSFFSDMVCSALNDKIYSRVSLNEIVDEKDRYVQIVTFQAIRLAALLHDLGHSPYSHVTEFALGKLYEEILSKNDVGKEITAREYDFLQIINHYKQLDKELHEESSLNLARRILSDVTRSISNNDKLRHDCIIISFLVIQIYTSNEPIFHALREIIDGDLDADRLDYVPRDLSMSGLSGRALRYGRLIESFQLVDFLDEGNTSTNFAFLPSVRALSTIEEFFQHRFRLYKYVIYHHRVVKTDGLFVEAVLALSRKLLSETESTVTDKNNYLLPDDISGLWGVLSPDQGRLRLELVNRYIQWDDPWLLSVLRKYYFSTLAISDDIQKSKDEKILQIQIEEIISSSRNYESLIKRAESFKEIDNAFLDLFVKEFDWKKLENKLGLPLDGGETEASQDQDEALQEYLIQNIRILKKYVQVYKDMLEHFSKYNKQRFTSLREGNGFFIVILSILLTDSGEGDRFGLPFLEQCLKQWREICNLDHAFLVQKSIKPGISNSFSLAGDGEIFSIGEVSSIAEELRRQSRLVPPFFVYIYREGGVRGKERTEMRQTFGKNLFEAFQQWLNNEGKKVAQ